MSNHLRSALLVSLEEEEPIDGTDGSQEEDGPKSADAIILEADSIVGVKDAVSPQELIEAAVQGEEVAGHLEEVADKADEVVEEDAETEVSAEMLTMNVQHVLQPLRLSNTMPSFEGASDLKQYHRNLAIECRENARRIREVSSQSRMRPSMENKHTYFFKTNKFKIEEAYKRIHAIKSGLSGKIQELEDHPATFNHMGLYMFLSMNDEVVKDPVNAFNSSVNVIETLYDLAVKDAGTLFKGIADAVSHVEDGDGATALERVARIKNPAASLAAKLNGARGVPIMGNASVHFQDMSGVKDIRSGSWTVGGYVDVKRNKPPKELLAKKRWLVLGGLVGASVGGAVGLGPGGMAAGMGAVAATAGRKEVTSITTAQLKQLVDGADKLMQFITDSRRDDDAVTAAYVSASNAVKNANLGNEERSIRKINEIGWDAYESASSVLIGRGLYLVGSVLQLVEHGIRKTK